MDDGRTAAEDMVRQHFSGETGIHGCVFHFRGLHKNAAAPVGSETSL